MNKERENRGLEVHLPPAGELMKRQTQDLLDSGALATMITLKETLEESELAAFIRVNTYSPGFISEIDQSEIRDLYTSYGLGSSEVHCNVGKEATSLKGVGVTLTYNFGKPEQTSRGINTHALDSVICTIDQVGTFRVLHERYAEGLTRSRSYKEYLFSEVQEGQDRDLIMRAILDAYGENEPPVALSKE